MFSSMAAVEYEQRASYCSASAQRPVIFKLLPANGVKPPIDGKLTDVVDSQAPGSHPGPWFRTEMVPAVP
jgi:hypothetical protein